MPFRRAFVCWELQHFERVPVGILEVEGSNPCGRLYRFRELLRAGRGVPHFVLSKPLVSPVHVAGYDGDMLEPAIVAVRIDGDWAAPRRQVFREFEKFIA